MAAFILRVIPPSATFGRELADFGDAGEDERCQQVISYRAVIALDTLVLLRFV